MDGGSVFKLDPLQLVAIEANAGLMPLAAHFVEAGVQFVARRAGKVLLLVCAARLQHPRPALMARQAGAVAFRDRRRGNFAEIAVWLVANRWLVDMGGAVAMAACACRRAGIGGRPVFGPADQEYRFGPVLVVAAGADRIAP